MAPIREVLLVDDEPDLRDIARISLSTLAGWTVRTAANGREALEALAEHKPDVILLDSMMPDMDGPTAVARFREHGAGDVPVVFVTARTRKEDVQAYLALGARGVIAKPFDPLRLADEVRRIVGSP